MCFTNKDAYYYYIIIISTDQSVLKRNARVLRTGSGQNGPAHGSEPLWRQENVRAHLGPCHLTGENQLFSAGQTGQMESDIYISH